MTCETHAYVKREDELKYARRGALWIIGQTFVDRHVIDVAIINLSECPIYDVYVIGCSYEKGDVRRQMYGAYDQRQMIPPNVNEAKKVFLTTEVLGAPKELSSVTATMFFRDINGIEWCRDSYGGLRKCPGYLNLFKNSLDKS